MRSQSHVKQARCVGTAKCQNAAIIPVAPSQPPQAAYKNPIPFMRPKADVSAPSFRLWGSVRPAGSIRGAPARVAEARPVCLPGHRAHPAASNPVAVQPRAAHNVPQPSPATPQAAFDGVGFNMAGSPYAWQEADALAYGRPYREDPAASAAVWATMDKMRPWGELVKQVGIEGGREGTQGQGMSGVQGGCVSYGTTRRRPAGKLQPHEACPRLALQPARATPPTHGAPATRAGGRGLCAVACAQPAAVWRQRPLCGHALRVRVPGEQGAQPAWHIVCYAAPCLPAGGRPYLLPLLLSHRTARPRRGRHTQLCTRLNSGAPSTPPPIETRSAPT